MTATPPQVTETPEAAVTGVRAPLPLGTLRDALDRVHLAGAIFLRAEYTEGWAYSSPHSGDLAGVLGIDADRLILFHIVARGRCWVSAGGGERRCAEAGDVIVLPYGDAHLMGGTSDAAVVSIHGLLQAPPWHRMPVIRHGLGGGRTDVICGYLRSADPLFDPTLRALPPAFVVRPADAAARWVEASVAYAIEEAQASGASGSVVTARLPELLLVEILRMHLASAPAAERGWLAALRDPALAPALAQLHGAPDRRWTVAELAAASHVSRSVLDHRFRQVLGRSPIRYLTDWRMHLAREMLGTADLGVAAVARRVGYDSAEAFSRAFKRASGRSPAHWRADRSPER